MYLVHHDNYHRHLIILRVWHYDTTTSFIS